MRYSSTSIVCLIIVVWLGAAHATAPRTDNIVASIGLTSETTVSERTCTGQDGQYVERQATLQGNLQSTDSRLNGILTVDGNFLINTDTQIGTSSGTFTIRNALTNALQMSGRYDGVIAPGGQFKGLAVASISGGAGGRLVTNFSVLVNPLLTSAVGNFGAPVTGVVSDPGVIQVGSCSGGFGQ
jgi:hypothetical protein